MPLDQPIFIFGAGRTGSTIFHRILCEHPRVAWITDFADRWKRKPARNRLLMRAVDLPLVGAVAGRIYPSECYEFWEHLCPGFRRPCRDLVAADVSPRSAGRVRSALGEIPTPRRDRLSIKITGWPRLTFLAEMFPEAKFIHLMRDGRMVANSFMNVPWWCGWSGPQNWRWGELSPEHDAEWRAHDRSFVALAGIQWKIFMDAVEAAKAVLPADRLLEIRYEDLCEAPADTFADALEFASLELTPRFEARLKEFRLASTGDKWQRHLSARQQEILGAVLASHLGRYGYAE